jgi:cyclase
MSLNRIIPLLLLDQKKLVKTSIFSNAKYVGDPKNTIRLFNEMNCSEIILLDIGITKKNQKINFKFLENIVSEAFMPVTYGGGVKNLDDINNLINIGCEKVSINNRSISDDSFFLDAVEKFGSSTIVASIDIVKKDKDNEFYCFNYLKNKTLDKSINQKIRDLNKYEIGEYLINFVENDGQMSGFDKNSIKKILDMTNSQITFCGGASSYQDMIDTFNCGAKSLAAGSLFVYQAKNSGVLINYPDEEEYYQMLQI